MALKLKILRASVQQDEVNTKDADEDGDELRNFKRVIAKGIAVDGQSQQKFKSILELRAGLLDVHLDAGTIQAGDVGRGLVHQMALYYHAPISRLLVRKTHSATRSTWVATDPVRVSGLLHQIGQDGEFVAQGAPPDPPGLKPILSELAEDLQKNLQEGLDLAQQARDNRLGTGVQMIDNSLWLANRDLVLDLVPSRHLRTQLIRLYESLEVLRGAVLAAQQNPPLDNEGRPAVLAAAARWPQRVFNIEFQRIHGAGLKVLRQIATEEQLKRWNMQPLAPDQDA